jgi:hypothetical protein
VIGGGCASIGHGVIRLAGGYNDQFITIAADPGHAPQVGWIEIGQGRKWCLRGLAVSPSLASSPLERVPRDHYILNTRFGINLCAPDCLAEGDVVANFSADGIRVTRDGQTVQYTTGQPDHREEPP